MKARLLIASLIAALTASFAAVAADAPAKDPAATTENAEKAPAAKKKAKPHYHPEANKQGGPAPEKTAPAGEAEKPLHEHQKEHKQQ